MNEDLKPGDEVWVRAILLSENEDGDMVVKTCPRLVDSSFRAHTWREDVRKSLPSEPYENLLKAAKHLLAHDDQSGYEELEAAVKAIGPPSLEDEIKGIVENWLREGKAAADYLIPSLVALIKAHGS